MNCLAFGLLVLIVRAADTSINLELNGHAVEILDLLPGGSLTFNVDGTSLRPAQFFSVLYVINQSDCIIQSTTVTSPSLHRISPGKSTIQSPFGSLYSTENVHIDYLRSIFTITIYGNASASTCHFKSIRAIVQNHIEFDSSTTVLPVKYEVDLYPGSGFIFELVMKQNLDFSLLARFFLSNSSDNKCVRTGLSYYTEHSNYIDRQEFPIVLGTMLDEIVMDGDFVPDKGIIGINHIGFFKAGDVILYHFNLAGDSLGLQKCSYSVELSALDPIAVKLNESIKVDLFLSPYYNANRSARFTTENAVDANESILINIKWASDLFCSSQFDDCACVYRLIGNGNESLNIFGLSKTFNEFEITVPSRSAGKTFWSLWTESREDHQIQDCSVLISARSIEAKPRDDDPGLNHQRQSENAPFPVLWFVISIAATLLSICLAVILWCTHRRNSPSHQYSKIPTAEESTE